VTARFAANTPNRNTNSRASGAKFPGRRPG
jgi:hypothetical protein